MTDPESPYDKLNQATKDFMDKLGPSRLLHCDKGPYVCDGCLEQVVRRNLLFDNYCQEDEEETE